MKAVGDSGEPGWGSREPGWRSWIVGSLCGTALGGEVGSLCGTVGSLGGAVGSLDGEVE